MGSQGEPWLDAEGLRLQIEGQIEVVKARWQQDPDHELDAETRGMIFAILSVADNRYGTKFILDIKLKIESWEKSREGPTVEKMWSFLESIRASLRRLERIEQSEGQPGAYDATTWGASRWGSASQHFGNPPDEPEEWLGDEGDRGYWAGVGSQHRRAVANRPRPQPW